MKPLPDDLPLLVFEDAAAWEAWLSRAEGAPGAWLRIAKAGSGIASITYDEALDAALCHGWIDGQRRAFDAATFVQRFTPRRSRSLWSRRNVGKVEALVAAGRMRAPGLREVERAKADGRWDAAYAGPAAREVPAELASALQRRPAARRFFDRLDSANRYAFCWRVQMAKRAETRRARAEQFAGMMERGETIHPPP